MAGLGAAPARRAMRSLADPRQGIFYPPPDFAYGNTVSAFWIMLGAMSATVLILGTVPFAVAWAADRFARSRSPRLAAPHSSQALCEPKGYEAV